MSRVYVGNLDPRTTERELEDEFRVFGVLRSVWVARNPPGYAFIEFDDRRDAMDAIHEVNGKNGWRVELSRSSGGGGGPRGRGGRGGDEMKCYECGEPGHFARECRLRIGPGGLGSGGRGRSRSPRYRRSPSYGRSPIYEHHSSYSRQACDRSCRPSLLIVKYMAMEEDGQVAALAMTGDMTVLAPATGGDLLGIKAMEGDLAAPLTVHIEEATGIIGIMIMDMAGAAVLLTGVGLLVA